MADDVRALRRALIRLLWNSAADGNVCSCEPDDPGPDCEAMRVLGWGEHWTVARFEEMARRLDDPLLAATGEDMRPEIAAALERDRRDRLIEAAKRVLRAYRAVEAGRDLPYDEIRCSLNALEWAIVTAGGVPEPDGRRIVIDPFDCAACAGACESCAETLAEKDAVIEHFKKHLEAWKDAPLIACICPGCIERVPDWWMTPMCPDCANEDCEHEEEADRG